MWFWNYNYLVLSSILIVFAFIQNATGLYICSGNSLIQPATIHKSHQIQNVKLTCGKKLTQCLQWLIDHSIDCFNTLRPRQNDLHFAGDIFKCILFNKTLFKILPKFVPEGPIYNIPALVRMMAWHPTGDKPLSEPLTALSTDACMRHLDSTI